jgi:hypothetical protein
MSEGQITTELIVGEIKRGPSAVLRARLTFHDGEPTIDVRVWARREDGTLRPTRSGFTLPRSKTRELCRLVRALGLAVKANRPASGRPFGACADSAQESA